MLAANPAFLLVTSFLAAILLGTVLLMLPISHTGRLSFIDALFTATSATCVTGLLTVNVAETFTHFGQAVILVLIQCGGIGIMTASTLFVLLLGKSVSMKGSSIVLSEFAISNKIDVRKLVKWVVFLVIALETVGAAVFFILWVGKLGVAEAAWAAIFHAVSAFCNAGISVLPDGPASMGDSTVVDMNFMFLMCAGSIGFITLIESCEWLKRRGKSQFRFSLHTRVVAIATLVFILIGVAGFFLFESDNILKGMSFPEKITSSFFHSISSRTTGFQKVDFRMLEPSTIQMFIILMFIGGAPGSTAGGVKITTFAVLFFIVVSRFRGSERVQMLGRTIPDEEVSRAGAVFIFLFVLLALFVVLLLAVNPLHTGAPIEAQDSDLPLVFESVSAFGTVGFSMGITSSLSLTGKGLIILMMFIGRLLGSILVLTLAQSIRPISYELTEESIMIG